MSIINEPEAKPTIEEVVSSIRAVNSDLYEKILAGDTALTSLLWNNSNYTTEEIMRAFGDDQAQLQMFSKSLYDAIRIINPTYKAPNVSKL